VRELRRHGEDHPRHRRRLIREIVVTGVAGSVASAAAALACSHLENGHAARPLNAVTHILDGGEPPAHDGRNSRNTALGFAIHTAASIWWAAFFEGFLGRPARRSPAAAMAAGAGIAALAYVVDYGVVGERFRPGFERCLSGRSMLAVYVALSVGFAAATLRWRRFPPKKIRRQRPDRRRAAEPA
jgi:hypothetical protein